MTLSVPQAPAQVYRGDVYRLNYTAGTVLTLLSDYGKRTVQELFDALNSQNRTAGIPGGHAGTQWTPPAPKPVKTFKGPKPLPKNTYKSTVIDPDDTDVPDLDPNDHTADDEDDVEYYPDTVRQYCTYFEADITRLRTVVRMLAFSKLVTVDADSVDITELGKEVTSKLRTAEDTARAAAASSLTVTQQYLLGDKRDKEGTHKIPFTVLPFSLSTAVGAVATLEDPDTVTAGAFDPVIEQSLTLPNVLVNQDTGENTSDDELPIRQSLHRHFSYRQFLQLLHDNKNVFVTAYAGGSQEAARLVGTKAQLGNPGDIANDPMLQAVKRGRSICKRTQQFVAMVLGGGPEGNWLGKPLRPSDVHNDVVSYTAAARPGFSERIMQGSSLAWETFDNLQLNVGDLERAREALYTAIGHGLVGQSEAPVPDIDPTAITDGIVTKGPGQPIGTETAGKRVVRTADRVLGEMGLDVETTPVVSPTGRLTDVMCQHVWVSNDKITGVQVSRRCHGNSIGGSGWCEMHGGTYLNAEETESLVRASQQKIFAGTSKAVEVMLDLMVHSTNDAVRLRAAEQVLNRGGLSESRDVNVNVEHTVEKSAAEKIRDRLNQLVGISPDDKKAIEADQNNGIIDQYGDPNIVDADVVDTD